MIKFKALNIKANTEFYGFGLTENNMIELKKGNPIYIRGDQIASIYDYLIFYGKTEKEMIDGLKDVIDPETELINEGD